MEDLISIIVPCYNVSNYIDDCFKSILNQTYKNIEVIFVDDGSTDDTGKKIDDFVALHNQFKVVHQVNQGLSSARNSGLRIATGKYIYFFDSDDFIHPEILSILHKNIVETDSSIAMCDYQIINFKKKYPNKFKKYKTHYKVYSGLDNVYASLFTIKGYAVWLFLYRHDLLKQMDNYPNIFNPTVYYAEDRYFDCIIHKYCTKKVHIKAPLYFYRVRKNSIMTSKFTARQVSSYDFADTIMSLDKNIYKKTYKRARVRICLDAMDGIMRIARSDFENPIFCKKLYSMYRDNVKYLPRSLYLPPWYSLGVPLTVPFMYLMFRKKMKDK